MTEAIDVARGGQYYSDAELDEPSAESPPRPTVGHADKFNADQFQGFVGNDETPKKAAAHPHYVNGRTLADYRKSPK
jgi:hypothetical protein